MSEAPAIITPMKLKRSNDRKVANLVTKNGKQAAIATRSDYLLERIILVLAQRLFARVSAMQESLKNYSRE